MEDSEELLLCLWIAPGAPVTVPMAPGGQGIPQIWSARSGYPGCRREEGPKGDPVWGIRILKIGLLDDDFLTARRNDSRAIPSKGTEF